MKINVNLSIEYVDHV